ncbi:hypothetical protein Pmani_026838 [Petrolisthes manimaculis]|uniref:Chitin-binding type-2 domain-containing protein n=1 Tax=Petrolisthes manimaculis TaxID=1843537 RepID=A0AAE1TZQ6_9EUCA|nr:hypothetical protein Pmani_026838 [Petrolisthes manimaculis]
MGYSVVGVSCVAGYTTEGSCVPDCTDVLNDFIQDPKDCTKYYVCNNGEANTDPFECPPLQYFNPATQQCEIGSCSPTDICVPDCRFEPVPGKPSVLAHRTSCSKYYSFDGVTMTEKDCGEGQYFNGQACVFDPNECCDPCLYFCETASTNIADPTNCRSYYHCLHNLYFPLEAELLYCPDGMTYSLSVNDCVTESDCSQLCTE